MQKKQNNLGIGVDIEETERFKNLDIFKNVAFLHQIYTKKELSYCFKKAKPYIHLAGRFVAKEAVFKALTSIGKSRGISLKKIEISVNIDNVPKVVVHGFKGKKLEVNLSISHCKSQAIAFAIVVSYEKFKRKDNSKQSKQHI